jgi:hypothetical protein
MGSMYGKARIVLTKDGYIVRAGSNTGGGNWHKMGKWHKDGLTYVATFLRREHQFDHQLTLENAERILCQSKNEIRERIWDLYA